MGGMADSPRSQVDAPTTPPADQAADTPGTSAAETAAAIPVQDRSSAADGRLRPDAGVAVRALAAAALDDLIRGVAEHARELAVGGISALVVAGGGWLVAAALTLAVWAMAVPSGGSFAAPLHVSGQLWLAAHHVLLHTPDGPFGLSPLGFTALPAGSLVLAGRYAAQRFGAGLWSLGAVAVCYPLAALAISWGAASGPLHAELAAAAGYPCLIASLGFAAGLLSVHTPRLNRWAATAVRAGTGSLAVLIAGAALLATLAVCLRYTDVVRLGNAIGQGTAGDAGLFLIDLALVPNLVFWALGFAVGPGFAVGQGSSVSMAGSTHGILPGLPLMQAVPPSGPLPPWAYLGLAVPLAAGTAAVLIIGWSVRGLADRAAALGAAVPAVGAVAGAAAVLSGGPVAAGAMSAVGPVPWQIALAVLGELGFVSVFGFGLWYAIDYTRGYLDRDRHPELGPEPRPERGGPLPGLDDDGLGELVGPGLVAAVPEGPEQVQDAGDDAGDPEDPVEEQPQEAEPGADGLAVGVAGEPDAHDALAVGLPAAPGPDRVEDGPDDAGQADEPEHDIDGVVAGGAGDPAGDDGQAVVEDEGPGPLPPVG
jgi:hypothetical protein